THAEDGHLRLIDDGRAEQAAVDPGIGDGERAALHLVRAEALGPRALAEIVDRASQSEDVLLLGVLHDRNDETPLQRDSDADVVVAVVKDAVLVHRGVEDGELAQCGDHRLDDEGEIGELHASLGECVLVLPAELFDVGEINLERGSDMSRSLFRQDHVPRDLLAHHGERLDADALAGRKLRLLLWGRRRPRRLSRGLLQESQDVVLGDAPRNAGALDLRDVDVVFLRDLAHQRRGFRAAPFVERSNVRGSWFAFRSSRWRGANPLAASRSLLAGLGGGGGLRLLHGRWRRRRGPLAAPRSLLAGWGGGDGLGRWRRRRGPLAASGSLVAGW